MAGDAAKAHAPANAVTKTTRPERCIAIRRYCRSDEGGDEEALNPVHVLNAVLLDRIAGGIFPLTLPVDPEFFIRAHVKRNEIALADIFVRSKGRQHGNADILILIEKFRIVIGHRHDADPLQTAW